MVMTTFSGYLVIQGGGTTAKPAAPVTQQGPATTGRDAQRVDTRELRDQIREQVRAAVAASAQAEAQADAAIPVPPTPPDRLRQFTIQGPNGERWTSRSRSSSWWRRSSSVCRSRGRSRGEWIERVAAPLRFRERSLSSSLRSTRPSTRSRSRWSESPRASATRRGCCRSSATLRDRHFPPALSVKEQLPGSAAMGRKGQRKLAPFPQFALCADFTAE